jgi:RNA polymerase sigma factor for flagellar operon FliA
MGETTTNAVINFRPLIRKIAAKLAAKLPPGVQLDDLMQDGMIGLIAAVRQSKVKDERFPAYAYQRIQGAMLDSLRDLDIAPTGLRKAGRQANAVVTALEQRLGRRPFESEIAAEMGIALTEYQRLLFDVYSSELLYLDPGEDKYREVFSVIDDGADPEARMERQRLIAAIDWAIEALSDRHRRIVAEIYRNGCSGRDLAARMMLSEGRISQLRIEALAAIRAHLRQRGLLPAAE